MYQLETARSFAYLMGDELAEQCAQAGIKKVELTLHSIAKPSIDFEPKVVSSKLRECLNILSKYDIEMLSLHLPFGTDWELCSCDTAIQERAVSQYLKLIECCNFAKPKRYVLHPGYPHVPAEERARRIQNFRRNVALLAKAAYPAKIAVENMPQDCLGNTSDELISLTDGIDNVCVCCDMNHWFHEKTYDAILNLGSRIETVHVSDYDEVVEKHWLPGEGTNDWNKIIESLQNVGYCGPFLYECGHGYSCKEVAENKNMLFNRFKSVSIRNLTETE